MSELLTFADSPQRYYRERLIQAGARAALSSVWDASPHEVESASAGDRDGQRAEAAVAWDEPREHVAGLDRAAVGRAVHAVLEYVRAGDETTPLTWLERAVEAEGGDDAFAEAVEVMVDRFLASPMGDSLRTALAEGRDVRREVALHARIRFPGGEPVAGFDSLLVKGSIDLWLPTDDGVLVVDHKVETLAAGKAEIELDIDVHEVEPVVLGAEDELLAIGRIGMDVLELAFQFAVGSNRGENIGFITIRQPIGSTGYWIKVVNVSDSEAVTIEKVAARILLAHIDHELIVPG